MTCPCGRYSQCPYADPNECTIAELGDVDGKPDEMDIARYELIRRDEESKD